MSGRKTAEERETLRQRRGRRNRANQVPHTLFCLSSATSAWRSASAKSARIQGCGGRGGGRTARDAVQAATAAEDAPNRASTSRRVRGIDGRFGVPKGLEGRGRRLEGRCREGLKRAGESGGWVVGVGREGHRESRLETRAHPTLVCIPCLSAHIGSGSRSFVLRFYGQFQDLQLTTMIRLRNSLNEQPQSTSGSISLVTQRPYTSLPSSSCT